MANDDLSKYIANARAQNVSDDEIKQSLLKSGWPENDVVSALSPNSVPTPSLEIPTPPVPHFGMWVTFQYIVLFISLFVSAMSLGGLFYNAVDNWFPDKLATASVYTNVTNSFNATLVRGYLAGLIVAFPIFAVLFLILKRQSITSPAIKNLRARKQLIYLTMVITFIIMLSHMVKVIYSLLGGELTANAGGHLAITFIIAGGIFFYLLYDVRVDRKNA